MPSPTSPGRRALGRGRPDRRAPTPHVGVLDLVAFVCEVVMLILLGIAGWQLSSVTLVRAVLALALPLAAALVWAVWMAPTSTRRLAQPRRLVAQIGLIASVGALVGFTGQGLVGAVFVIVAVAVFGRLSRAS